MAKPDILFAGIPRTPTRTYTSETLRVVKPSKVVIPCTGSFSLAWAALSAGVPAQNIISGDISLYSTALGNAIMGTDWRLDLLPAGSEQDTLIQTVLKPLLTSPTDKAIAVLMAVRILQYERKVQKVYHTHRQRELILNAPTAIAEMARLANERLEQLSAEETDHA